MPGVFVAGTDTDVGKTFVAAGILMLLRRSGLHPAPFKPVETGHGGGRGWPADAEALRRTSGLELRREEVVPYVFEEALAPAVASRRAGIAIDPFVLDSAYRSLESRHGFVVVEGAGGMATPLCEGMMVSDLAVRWNLPVVLVCRPDIGTLSHTVLAVEHARAKGLRILGLVVDRLAEPPAVAESSNLEELPRLTKAPLLAAVPEIRSARESVASWDAAALQVAKLIDPQSILGPSQPSSPTRAWKR